MISLPLLQEVTVKLLVGNLSTPSRLRGCEYPKTNLRPQAIGAQSTFTFIKLFHNR